MSAIKLVYFLLLDSALSFQIGTFRKSPLHSATSTNTRSAIASNPTLPVVASKTQRENTKPTLRRPKWGTDPMEMENEYWYDQRIHTLGNIGISGALHAALAPASTKVIDMKAYEGVDIRGKIAKQLANLVQSKSKLVRPRVLDLCCGVGFSTRALQRAFPWAESVIGIDTSDEMIAMAKFITDHERTVSPYFARNLYHRLQQSNVTGKLRRACATFRKANAEDTKLPGQQFDLVTVMYAFHEAPRKGRDAILREARRLLKPSGTLAVIDISTEYQPSPAMLAGEPYVQDYQKQIHSQLNGAPGFEKPKYQTVIPNHLGMWTLRRAASMLGTQMA